MAPAVALLVVHGCGRDRWPVGRLERRRGAEPEGDEVPVCRVSGARAPATGAGRVRYWSRQRSRSSVAVHRAQAEEHLLRPHRLLSAIAGQVAVAHAESFVAGAEPGHLRPGRHLGAGALGECQVVEVERVLRAEVAADVALAAVRAPALQGAELVRPRLLSRSLEPHGQVRPEGLPLAAEPGCGGLHEARLRRQLAGRRVLPDGSDVEHVPDEVVVRVERRARVRSGPVRVEHVGRRPYLHVCVDQRPSAIAHPLHHQHVTEMPDVVGPAAAPMLEVWTGPVARKGPERKAPAALDQRHVDARLREPARRNGTPEAAAHDDRLVAVLGEGHDETGDSTSSCAASTPARDSPWAGTPSGLGLARRRRHRRSRLAARGGEAPAQHRILGGRGRARAASERDVQRRRERQQRSRRRPSGRPGSPG